MMMHVALVVQGGGAIRIGSESAGVGVAIVHQDSRLWLLLLALVSMGSGGLRVQD